MTLDKNIEIYYIYIYIKQNLFIPRLHFSFPSLLYCFFFRHIVSAILTVANQIQSIVPNLGYSVIRNRPVDSS